MPGDLRLALRVQADMESALRGMRKLNEGLGTTKEQGGKVRRAFGKLGRGVDTLRDKFGGLKGVLGALGLGVAVRGIVRATSRQEQAVAQVERGLKNLGDTTNLTSGGLQQMAASLQTVTTFGDEAILELQALLLTFRKIDESNFDRVTVASLDLATALGQAPRDAALQLAKSLEDPAQGLTALRRSGTVFSEEQTRVIKQLAETNRLAEAQGLILAEVERQYGGSARAARDTLGGSAAALRNAAGDLFERADEGGQLRESIEGLVRLFQDPATIEGVRAFTSVLIDGLTVAVGLVGDLGRAINRLTGEVTPAQDIAEALDARDGGFFDQFRIGGDGPFFDRLDEEEIDALIRKNLEKLRAAGETLPASLVRGIRESGADVPEALLEAVTPPDPFALAKVGKDTGRQAGAAIGTGLAQGLEDGEAPTEESVRRTADVVAELAERIGDDAERVEQVAIALAALAERTGAALAQVSAEAEAAAQTAREATERAAAAQAAPGGGGGAAGISAQVLHAGGIAGAPGGVTRTVAAALFAGAPHFQSGGRVAGGGEVPAILHRGELVLTPEQQRALGLDAAQAGLYGELARIAADAYEEIGDAAEEAGARQSAAGLDWYEAAEAGLARYRADALDGPDRIAQATQGAFRSMEDALVGFVTTGKFNFSDLANTIIADLARIAVRQSITGPLADALFGALAGLGGGPAPGADAFRRLQAGVAHAGGVAGAPGGVSRTVPAALFAGAPRYHAGGVAGLRPDEVPIIARRGEGVITPQQMRALGSPNVTVNVENRGSPQRVVDRRVEFDPRGIVVSVVTDDLDRNGPISQHMRRNMGVRGNAG